MNPISDSLNHIDECLHMALAAWEGEENLESILLVHEWLLATKHAVLELQLYVDAQTLTQDEKKDVMAHMLRVHEAALYIQRLVTQQQIIHVQVVVTFS